MAFVLINAEIGSEDQVVKELKSVPQVKEAYMVYGVYDIVAKVSADTMDKLKEIITWKVRHLNKVKSTLTMIVIENYYGSQILFLESSFRKFGSSAN